jgi:hypothetical protein
MPSVTVNPNPNRSSSLLYTRNQPRDQCCAPGERLDDDVLIQRMGTGANRTETI